MRQDAVTGGVLFPGRNLPGAVHFIAQIPGLDAVRRLMAVLGAQIGPIGAALEVGIFHDIGGVRQGADAGLLP